MNLAHNFDAFSVVPVCSIDIDITTMTLTKVLRSPLGRWLWSPASRKGAVTASLVDGRRFFTGEAGRPNEDNMSSHHQSHELPPQQWTMFNGKVAVLQDAAKAKDEREEYNRAYGENPRMSVLMELTDSVGKLHDVLRFFWKYDVNICRIESRPVQSGSREQKRFDFFVDFEGNPSDENVFKLLDALKSMTRKLLVLDEKQVHWFPRHISELDMIVGRTLDAGIDLESDHPGFLDMDYRKRRAALTQAALNHRWDQPIETIDYVPEEIEVWSMVWDKMEGLWDDYACKEFIHSMELMKEHCGYGRDNIPQQQDISEFLMQRTNFRMRPVAGLLSSRDFLNGLAFRVFFSTQYIRHHSMPCKLTDWVQRLELCCLTPPR
jgi:hypothetical protein